MQKFFLVLVCLVYSVYSSASAADVFVAVNKANNNKIDEKIVLKILKAQTLTWEDGNAVVLMIDDLDSTNASDFSEVLDMSKSQFLEYWRIKFFSGRALIPKQIKRSANAASILVENKNGVYISIGKVLPAEITENAEIKTSALKF